MKQPRHLIAPTYAQLKKSCRRYELGTEPSYRVLLPVIEGAWEQPGQVADAIVVLLQIWNKAFYNRYGCPKAQAVEKALRKNWATIDRFARRSILDYNPEVDSQEISHLFCAMLEPLKGRDRKRRARRTPVGVAKALHFLAPRFFPMWDTRIARESGCAWSPARSAASCYLRFIAQIRGICESLVDGYAAANGVDHESAMRAIIDGCCSGDSPRSLVKLVDEYAYRLVKQRVRGAKRSATA
jgi:hypothetical protein